MNRILPFRFWFNHMYKNCLIPLLACSLPVVATPYVGIEMGYAIPHHDMKMVSDGSVISPDSNDLFLGFYSGYQFDKTWALELGYQQNQYTGTDKTRTHATLDSDRFYLAPVYSISLTNDRDWNIKFKAGVSYAQYEFTGQNARSSQSRTSSDLGVIAAAGIEYRLMPELGMGLNYSYQSDSFASASALSLFTQYYF